MAAPVSFQGLSTNLPTDKLIDAIITQEGQPMVRAQGQQTANNQKSAALTSLKSEMTGLGTSMASLTDTGFMNRTVTSNDPSNSFVTATAYGAAPAAYEVAVTNLATRAHLVVPVKGGVDAEARVGRGTYTLTDMDGHSADIKLTGEDNSLSGLRDAVNAARDSDGKPLNVNASVIKTGVDGTSQLVLNAVNTGKGKDGTDTFSFEGPWFNDLALNSATSTAAVNAHFTVNGAAVERATNTVSDAVDGMTFNLLAGDPTKSTTLTVALDKTAITTAMQDVVTKYNALYKDYKAKTTSTTDKDGKITNGVFNNDYSIRTLVNQVHDALMGAPTGLAKDASYPNAASVGLKTNRDGSISLSTSDFQAALDRDSTGVANVFASTGKSTSPLLTYLLATPQTTSAPINFDISGSEGDLKGEFSTTGKGGVPFRTTLSSSDGKFRGVAGTPLEGLAVSAKPGASGTLNISTGVAQNLQDVVNRLTSSSSGNLGSVLQNISTQNYHLSHQIATQQERLDHRKQQLHDQYSKLETTVGQLQAAGQSVSSM